MYSKEVGQEGQLPREYASVFKSLQFLTVATLLGQSKWRESRESARRRDRVGYQYEGASGPLIKVCGVSMDVSFQGGSNETIGGCVRLRQLELLLI
jgi:hypothetical protein